MKTLWNRWTRWTRGRSGKPGQRRSPHASAADRWLQQLREAGL